MGRLAVDVERGLSTPALTPNNPGFERSWCNGAAGLVLLLVRAYESSRDEQYLSLSRSYARTLLTHTEGVGGDLCCGLGGRSYALLAMDRIDPGRDWARLAVNMGALAADALVENSGPWPNGLYKGFPGLVYLAEDLSKAPRVGAGFPFVEG
jgi:serine/threonine-protein kinase